MLIHLTSRVAHQIYVNPEHIAFIHELVGGARGIVGSRVYFSGVVDYLDVSEPPSVIAALIAGDPRVCPDCHSLDSMTEGICVVREQARADAASWSEVPPAPPFQLTPEVAP